MSLHQLQLLQNTVTVSLPKLPPSTTPPPSSSNSIGSRSTSGKSAKALLYTSAGHSRLLALITDAPWMVTSDEVSVVICRRTGFTRRGGRLRIVSVQQGIFAVLLSGSYSLWQLPTHVSSPPLPWGAHVSGKKFPIRAPGVRGAATPENKAARAAAVHTLLHTVY